MVFWASVNAECLPWRRGRQISLILALLLLLFERRREVTTLWRCTNAFIINTQTARHTRVCLSAIISLELHVRSSPNFFCVLPMDVPSVLWRCWLGDSKGIRPVRVVGYWRGYLSRARCRIVHMASLCHCHSLSLASIKSRLVLPFWYRLTRVVPEKRAVKRVCVCVCVCVSMVVAHKSVPRLRIFLPLDNTCNKYELSQMDPRDVYVVWPRSTVSYVQFLSSQTKSQLEKA